MQEVEDEEARRTFSRKAKVFGGVLRAAELMHGSRIAPANFKGTSGWLRALTAYAGSTTRYDRRPVLGAETLDVVDELRDCAERLGDEEMCAFLEHDAEEDEEDDDDEGGDDGDADDELLKMN